MPVRTSHGLPIPAAQIRAPQRAPAPASPPNPPPPDPKRNVYRDGQWFEVA